MDFFDSEFAPLFFGFGLSFVCSIALAVTTKWHGKFTLDGTNGVQKIHVIPTPRIGGAAIVSGLSAACAFTDDSLPDLLLPILIAGLPAFGFGIAEDFTKRISVRTRLFATMGSGVLAWLLTGVSITRIGIVGVDDMLAFTPLAVLFTAFAVGGVANAVNIIDGFNGLASGTVMICVGALGIIAHNVGDGALSQLCFVVLLVTLGFFLVNFPFGKLFLGDGGAYMLGFIMAWLAISLVYRNPSVSVWAPFAACAYPVFETVFTIVRRLYRKSDPGQPDNRHLHSLVNQAIAPSIFGRVRADFQNAAVSPFSWVIAIIPSLSAIKFPENTVALILALVLSFVIYLGAYGCLVVASKARRPNKAAQGENQALHAEEVSLSVNS